MGVSQSLRKAAPSIGLPYDYDDGSCDRHDETCDRPCGLYDTFYDLRTFLI